MAELLQAAGGGRPLTVLTGQEGQLRPERPAGDG